MLDRYKIFSILIITILSLAVPFVSLAWQVKIIVSTPDPNADSGLATNNLYFGVDPKATNDYDNLLDTIALLIGPVQAYFSHPEYQSNLQKLWRDFRAEALPQVWEMLVTTLNPNTLVDFTWSGSIPRDVNLTLIDTESNQIISMNTSTQYSYLQLSAAQKKFLIQAIYSISDTTPPASPTNLRVW